MLVASAATRRTELSGSHPVAVAAILSESALSERERTRATPTVRRNKAGTPESPMESPDLRVAVGVSIFGEGDRQLTRHI